MLGLGENGPQSSDDASFGVIVGGDAGHNQLNADVSAEQPTVDDPPNYGALSGRPFLVEMRLCWLRRHSRLWRSRIF